MPWHDTSQRDVPDSQKSGLITKYHADFRRKPLAPVVTKVWPVLELALQCAALGRYVRKRYWHRDLGRPFASLATPRQALCSPTGWRTARDSMLPGSQDDVQDPRVKRIASMSLDCRAHQRWH